MERRVTRRQIVGLAGAAIFPGQWSRAAESAHSTLQRSPYVINRFGVLTDHTLSATRASTPPIQPADLKPMIQFCATNGGEMAIFPVRAQAEGGLLRMLVPPSAPEPAAPDVSAASVFEKKKALQQYRIKVHEWGSREMARRNAALADAERFEAQLPYFLLAARTEKRSDVMGALIRMDRFLLEPAPASNQVVKPMILICSDLIDTRSAQTYAIASDPTAAWVYREKARRIPGLNPTMFEAVTPAITWLLSKAQSTTR